MQLVRRNRSATAAGPFRVDMWKARCAACMIPADVQQYVIVSASEGFQYMEEDMLGRQVRTRIGKDANCRLPPGRNLGSDVGSAPVDSPENVSMRDIPDSVAIVKAKKGIT